MEHRVALSGGGRVEVAAYGLADAEHQVEKEIAALWPEAAVEVTEVSRAGSGTIVEEFAVRYRVRGMVTMEAASPAEARSAALRVLRDRFAASRYARIAWDPVAPPKG